MQNSRAKARPRYFCANRTFGTIEVAGRPLILRGDPSGATVIGVAADTDVGGLFFERRGLVYLPLTQRYDSFLSIAVRSRGRQAEAVEALRAAIHRADPDLPVALIGAGREVLAGPWEFLRALGVCAAEAGQTPSPISELGGRRVLSPPNPRAPAEVNSACARALGGRARSGDPSPRHGRLFGIESHIVSRRTREIGVRMSFGASAAQIKRMVLKDGSRPVLEGLVLGMVMGLTSRAIVRSYMEVDMSIVDPWTLFVVPIPLILSAYCACYLPASRAAAVDPSVALRSL